MPNHKYKSISVHSELVKRINQVTRQTGTYHSTSEFISEAIRLRLEDLERSLERRENLCSSSKEEEANYEP